ncbi:MAG: substrate-binding domain-containing protein [Halomonas venusta]|nr:substrate-binding domain-containing protein [Halomonas venusta]
MSPGITTLAQPTDAIGQAAVACLLNQLPQHPGKLAVQALHSPTLIIRGSTSPSG